MTEPEFQRTTRASYDAIAADYAERFRAGLAGKPLDRALLAGFAELVQAAGAGPVADLGCGPGHVTAHLHGLGLTVFGIDLSPQMVALARRALDFYRRQPDRIAELLSQAGLLVRARLLREPDDDGVETTPQALPAGPQTSRP